MVYSFETVAKLAKPCPLCGCKTIVVENREFFEQRGLISLGFECTNCRLVLRKGDSKDYNEAYRAVLSAWNRRVNA